MATDRLPSLTLGLMSFPPVSEANRGAALVLDNFIPMSTGVRVRGGKKKHANTGGFVPHSFLRHYDGDSRKLFAVSNGVLRDVTAESPASPPPALLSLLGDGVYSSVQFANAGNEFLIGVNGTAKYIVYNLTAGVWTQNPAGLTPDNSQTFDHVCSYKNRLYFAIKGEKQLRYLGVDSITGPSTLYDLQGAFTKGGKLLFCSSWSNDSGDGQDDLFVAVSDLGEVLVFSGLFPGDPNWTRLQRYEIPRPIGKNFHIRVGGDLLIGTVDGLVPLSAIQNKDPTALSQVAITRNIKPDWDAAVKAYGDNPNWSIAKWAEAGYLLVAPPQPIVTTIAGTAITDPSKAFAWAINLFTGAVGRIKSWDVQSFTEFDGRGFFGSADGFVYEAETNGNDDGMPILAHAVWWPDDLGTRNYKGFNQAKIYFEHIDTINPLVAASVDYAVDSPKYPSTAVPDASVARWGSAIWNQSVWASDQKKITANWSSLGRSGTVVMPSAALNIHSDDPPVIEMRDCEISFDPSTEMAPGTGSRVIDRSEVTGFSPMTVDGNDYKVRIIVHH